MVDWHYLKHIWAPTEPCHKKCEQVCDIWIGQIRSGNFATLSSYWPLFYPLDADDALVQLVDDTKKLRSQSHHAPGKVKLEFIGFCEDLTKFDGGTVITN